MKAGSALWAASCALMSVQMTLAQAAPAPQEGQRQLRPRYYFPRHVKRELFSNNTVSIIGDAASPNSSPSPAVQDPSPSPAVSPAAAAASVSLPASSPSAGLVAGALGDVGGLVNTLAGAVNSVVSTLNAAGTVASTGGVASSLPSTPAAQAATTPQSVASVASSVANSVASDTAAVPQSLPVATSSVAAEVVASPTIASTGGAIMSFASPTSTIDLVGMISSAVNDPGTLVGLSTIIPPTVSVNVPATSLLSSVVNQVPSLISSVAQATGAAPSLSLPAISSALSDLAPLPIPTSAPTLVVPTLPVPTLLPSLPVPTSALTEILPSLPLSSALSQVVQTLPPVQSIPSAVVNTLPPVVSSVVSEAAPPPVSSVEVVPTLPATVVPTVVPTLPMSQPTVVAPTVVAPTSAAAVPTLPVGTAVSESVPLPEPTSSIAVAVPTLPSVSVTGEEAAPSTTKAPEKSTPAPNSIVPTGTDTETALSLPSSIIVQTSLPGQTLSTTATGIPTSMPKVISPAGGVPTKPSNTTLVQVGFQHELNYAFVSGNPNSAAQIFSFLPEGIVYGLGLDDSGVRMQSLQPYDMSKTQGWIMTLALFYVPSDMINQLAVDIHTPNSDLYNHPNPTISTLMNLIVPSIPLLAGLPMDGTSSTNDGTQAGQAAAVSPGAAGGGAPFGGDAGNSAPVSKSAAAIAAPIATGGLLYGAAMVLVARRYRKRRQGHQRSSSMPSERMPNARDSRGSGSTNGRSITTQQISAPVMSENSLGWN